MTTDTPIASAARLDLMRLAGPDEQPLCSELDVVRELVPLTGAQILELGCGAADKTRQIAAEAGVAGIVAAEVDRIQHEKNLQLDDLPSVTFRAFGAEAIELDDASVDVVLMFKSLHHVPVAQLHRALEEIRRVLRPGGLAYISEPVFSGEFNEILRLFHDESEVRRAAFEALCQAVAGGRFELVTEHFFRNVVRFDAFEQFQRGIIGATHTSHQVEAPLLARIREAFEVHRSEAGYVFEIPNRVDLLRKPRAQLGAGRT